VARKVVGLDVGATAIRAAIYTTKGKGQPALERMVSIPLEHGWIVRGEIREAEKVVAALKQLWSDNKIDSKSVVFSLSSPQVLAKQMTLDWLEAADFRKALPYQVADVLSFPVEEAVLDYHVLDDFYEVDGDPQSRKLTVLLIAAPAALVEEYLTLLGQAGLKPVRADVASFALIRAQNPNLEKNKHVEAVIDMGADLLKVVIQEDGQPRFVRTIADQGGNMITSSLVDMFGWTWEDAESTKFALGLGNGAGVPGGGVGESVFGTQTAQPAQAEHPAQKVINQKSAGFVNEIRSSLDFFLSVYPDLRIARVVLTGGGAQMVGLTHRLNSELRVPVEVADPVAVIGQGKVQVPDDAPFTSAEMATAIGLGAGVN
jgi:type IV pilus assembly protein PilM